MKEIQPLTRAQVRDVDRIAIEEFGVPGIVLMENAGIGATKVIDRFARDGPIVIVCGSGNNGGDGYVVARHLQLRGHSVQVISLVDLDRLQGDAKTNATIANKAEIPIHCLADAGAFAAVAKTAVTIVDGMLGTGARGPLKGRYADVVSACNAVEALRIALDIPTGMDCDSGEVSDPTFQADHTVTFVAKKIGFTNPQAAKFLGDVHVVPIGAPQKLLDTLKTLR